MRNTRPDFWKTDKAEKSCNCGSFALNLTTWFAPYLDESEIDDMDDVDAYQYSDNEREHLIEELLWEGYDREDIMDIILERDWQFILMTCPWLVPIQRDDIDEKDRVIAYRLMLEETEPDEFDADLHTDFHFRVLIDGKWWEKNGNGPIHTCGDFADEAPWHCETWMYDSGIKYAKFREGV
jgi:hypothetical protein